MVKVFLVQTIWTGNMSGHTMTMSRLEKILPYSYS